VSLVRSRWSAQGNGRVFSTLLAVFVTIAGLRLSSTLADGVQHERVRPLRIPAHVALGESVPPVARAGEKGSWTLHFTLAKDVPPNQELWLYVHGGRHVKPRWPGLQSDDESAEGYVSLVTEAGVRLRSSGADAGRGVFAFAVPEGGLKAGERLIANLGGKAGTTAPRLSMPDSFFLLLTAKAGTTPQPTGLQGGALERIVGACMMDITGNDLRSIRAYAASDAVIGSATSILVRPEDVYGNVSNTGLGRLVVRLNGKEIEAKRTPIANSNCCRLSGITFHREGVYRLEVQDGATGLKALTNPIRCIKVPSSRLLWGVLHGHTECSDGSRSLDHYYAYMRDECGLDFGAASDHDHPGETTDEMWSLSQQAAVRYNAPGRFTTFLGYEWARWLKNGDGDRNVYYLQDNRPMFRCADNAYPRPSDLFGALARETAMVIPHHPAEAGNFCDWKDHDPVKERLVEIYSVWGSSERSVNQGSPFPVKGKDPATRDSGEVPAGFVQRALELGWRVGFTAGTDNHFAHAGDMVVPEEKPWDYRCGVTAVRASGNTREAIWNAFRNRRCYGTTGARIIADFTVNGHQMGSVLAVSDHKDLSAARKLRVEVHGTAKIKTIEIVRNNKDVHTVTPHAMDAKLEWADTAGLRDVNLAPAEYSAQPFTFYYIRITQEDGEMAWLSPIWIVSD